LYRILIVDDEPMIRMGLEKMIHLMHPGAYSIRAAEHGEHALELIEQECPDFLFTDIRMPKMDGLELCRRLSLHKADIQIVVISGYGDFKYAQKCLSYGVKEYLLKPVSKASLKDTLMKLEKSSQQQKQSAYVTVAKLDERAISLANAIWSLDRNLLEQTLNQFQNEDMLGLQTLGQQSELMEQFYELLVKKLVDHDVRVGNPVLDLGGAPTPEAAYVRFEAQVEEIYESLKLKRKGKYKDPVEEAKRFIEGQLSKETSLDEVAEMLGLNASYFSQLFKQSTGETFVHFRTRCRMEKAKRLLEQPHYRITDVSYEIGYADHPHFTKTFKKFTGLSPSEYRSKMGIE
jgi:two-component system response regulator YesN